MGKKKKESLRELLVNTIIENASDEMEDHADYIQLAIESEEELVKRVINILEFYRLQISI
jgi:chemotaxis regulatin CheY-phosphate phosphatase CheZ